MSTKKSTERSAGSSRRKASSRRTTGFDPTILAKAREIVRHYKLVIEERSEGGYSGTSVEMPLVFARGNTYESCARELLDALAHTAAVEMESGIRPASPARSGKREVQVNLRLNADEKILIEESARRAGFRSISDYIRTAALRNAS